MVIIVGVDSDAHLPGMVLQEALILSVLGNLLALTKLLFTVAQRCN